MGLGPFRECRLYGGVGDRDWVVQGPRFACAKCAKNDALTIRLATGASARLAAGARMRSGKLGSGMLGGRSVDA